jgi:hypothetical protein
MNSKTNSLETVVRLLLDGNEQTASAVLLSNYPSPPVKLGKRSYSPKESLEIFRRDGFTDRYSGDQLIFPGMLRLIHKLLPKEFPFHKNWKMSETHIGFWELFPTIDHVVPVARSGPDTIENWVTTSQIRNSSKSNWLLDELGWKLLPPGDIRAWDGMTNLFLECIAKYPEHLSDAYIGIWHKAAISVEDN